MCNKSVWVCNKCGQEWRYKPKREFEDTLSNGQCDCGNFIDTHNAYIVGRSYEGGMI